MLTIDVIGFLINQKNLVILLERMQKVDDKLLKENIHIDYRRIKRLTIILILVATIIEIGLLGYNFLLFQQNLFKSIWWLITFVPLYLSSISKIWFIVLVYNVQQKFTAINEHFENTGLFFEEMKKKNVTVKKSKGDNATLMESDLRMTGGSNVMVDHNSGYLQKEIYRKRLFKRNSKIQNFDSTISSQIIQNDIVQVLPLHNGI